MTDALSSSTTVAIEQHQIPQHDHPRPHKPHQMSIPQSHSMLGVRSGHLNLDTFSPVNQNGSFAFDRVLKSGEVLKRTKKTKQWKPVYLVLRPNLLSIYKNSSEERLHKQISLSDVTAVAYLKDPKGRRQHIFGLFSPSRNYHLQAKDERDSRSWVELIKHEARIDEEEQEILIGSPTTKGPVMEHSRSRGKDLVRSDDERLGSSSPEPFDFPMHRTVTRDGVSIPALPRPSAYDHDYSGDDMGPSSDFSDTPLPQNPRTSTFGSLLQQRAPVKPKSGPSLTPRPSNEISRPETAQNGSQLSIVKMEQDEERVIWHGYLHFLRSKGGVRQWKRYWVVLRQKNLAFYKSEEEYAAHLIIPLSTIISAVEIDPISKSKTHCIQIIAEEKNYRFCAPSEEALARWLGALKTHLARRKEANNRKSTIS